MENNRLVQNRSTSHATKRGRTFSPSRLLVLESLESQVEPLTLPAIVRRVGLHENTVRGHLENLLADGYAIRSLAEPEGRGRPAWLWSTPHKHHHSDDELEYAGLAAVLADSISAFAPDPVATALQAGNQWGKTLADNMPHTEPALSPVTAAITLLDSFGFAPLAINEQRIELHTCPLLEAAHRNPDVVCSVHLGIINGALSRQGIDSSQSQLEPFSAPGICTLHFSADNTPQQRTDHS
ncbi:helix-turn-helix transcriptional regulator [Timonella sp. A28]|uniref:helix-turn-helix transcriptional regulator n=1 Tax=Timonella sp. A28 TaxID=3442640 RepID=UPI003EBA99F0